MLRGSQSQQRLGIFSQGQKRRSLERFEPNSTNFGINFPSTAKNVAELGFSELERIKEKVAREGDPELLRKIQAKEQLHGLSMKRIEKWPNTIYTVKKNKENSRFNKFQAEELERQKVDESERLYQQQIKTDILDRANKQIYEKQDRVRSFQSKLLLSDALQERAEQVDLKRTLADIEKLRGQMYEEQALELLKQQDEENDRKLEKLQEKKKIAKKILKEQHDEQKKKRIEAYQQEYLEGQIMKLKVEEAIELERENQKMRRMRNIKLQEDIVKNNDLVIKQKELQAQKEKEEEERIRQHFLEKEKIQQMRHLREELKFKEKQEQKQKLIDAQAKRLLELKGNEEQRLNNQIQEVKQKMDDEEKKKQEMRRIMEEKMRIAAAQTVAKKAEVIKREKEEDKLLTEFWHKKNQDIKLQEVRSHQEQRDRERTLQEYHVKQITEKEKHRESQYLEELETAEKIKGQMERDDKTFNTWAERAIVEWDAQGKDLFPMLKELKEYKKKTWMENV